MGPTIWSFNGVGLVTQASGNNPYYRNNVPTPLIIPSFTATYAGIYRCTGVYVMVTINLAISRMYNYNSNLCILCIMSELAWLDL